MEIPVELMNVLQGLLVAGVTWLVVAGFKGLGEAFGKDFSNLAKAVAAVVSAGVVSVVFGLIDLGLAAVPVQYAQIVQAVFSLLVVILSSMGIQRQSKK